MSPRQPGICQARTRLLPGYCQAGARLYPGKHQAIGGKDDRFSAGQNFKTMRLVFLIIKNYNLCFM